MAKLVLLALLTLLAAVSREQFVAQSVIANALIAVYQITMPVSLNAKFKPIAALAANVTSTTLASALIAPKQDYLPQRHPAAQDLLPVLASRESL